jgi:hypothetical protein
MRRIVGKYHFLRNPNRTVTNGGFLVIAAAWTGLGFDLFDALLFNFVAPNCIPSLVHQPRGSRARGHGPACRIVAGSPRSSQPPLARKPSHEAVGFSSLD